MQVDLGTMACAIRAWEQWNPGAVVITPGDIHRCKPVTDDFKLLPGNIVCAMTSAAPGDL